MKGLPYHHASANLSCTTNSAEDVLAALSDELRCVSSGLCDSSDMGKETLSITLQLTDGVTLRIDVALRKARQQCKAEGTNYLVPPEVLTASLETGKLIRMVNVNDVHAAIRRPSVCVDGQTHGDVRSGLTTQAQRPGPRDATMATGARWHCWVFAIGRFTRFNVLKTRRFCSESHFRSLQYPLASDCARHAWLDVIHRRKWPANSAFHSQH